MVKCFAWTPLPEDFPWPAPIVKPRDPTTTPRTDAPGTPFPFLSLPRELRDLVYAYTLPPFGLCHRQRASQVPTQWTTWTPKPPSHLPLLLASRQLHDEVETALFHAYPVEVLDLRSHRTLPHNNSFCLQNTLRLFPSAPAGLISLVLKQYAWYTQLYVGETGKEIDHLFAMWEHVVHEAYVMKQFFPRLRRFTARYPEFENDLAERFFMSVGDVDESDVAGRQTRVDEYARVLLVWLKTWLGEKRTVPPSWLNIEMVDIDERHPEFNRCRRLQQDALNLAHQWLAKERTVTQEELDASGTKWLEEWSAQRVRRKKKWQHIA